MSRLRLLLALTLVVGAGAGCSDDNDGSATGSRREFCAELRAVVEAHLTIFDPLQPASREDTGQAMDRLADAAPEAIATEMTRLADTFEAVVEVLDEVNPSEPEAADRLAALDIDENEIAAAQATVNAFALDKCRIDLAAINAESVPTTSTTTSTTLPPPTTAPSETTVAPTTVAPTTAPSVSG
ncbi:MAG: hypothetical protein ABWZ14_12625 [Acidimicrobiales bacterium]